MLAVNRRVQQKARFVKFHRRSTSPASRVAIFPGSFNPPTVAHLALAHAALAHADEVVFILPQAFPHKDFSGVDFAGRLELLLAAADHPRFTIATTAGGLFLDIAHELRPHYSEAAFQFLCGRDAAERILDWPYPVLGTLERMFQAFGLLVAARAGHYQPPALYAEAIIALELEADLSHISATQVRQLIEAQGDWQSLIPAAIAPRVARLYGPPR